MSYASTDVINLAANGDIFQWAEDTLSNVKELATLGAMAMAMVATVMAYAKTRSWAGTLTAAVLGALVVYAVSNMDFLSQRVGSEVPKEQGLSAYSVPLDGQPHGLPGKGTDLL